MECHTTGTSDIIKERVKGVFKDNKSNKDLPELMEDINERTKELMLEVNKLTKQYGTNNNIFITGQADAQVKQVLKKATAVHMTADDIKKRFRKSKNDLKVDRVKEMQKRVDDLINL